MPTRFELETQATPDPRGNGLVVEATLKRYPGGAVKADYQTTRIFSFRKAKSDEEILTEIEKWFDAQARIRADKIARAELAERAEAIDTALEGRKLEI